MAARVDDAARILFRISRRITHLTRDRYSDILIEDLFTRERFVLAVFLHILTVLSVVRRDLCINIR